jgi:hypothetical protein
MDDNAECGQCRTPLPDEDPENRSKCPNCGSFQRLYSAHIEETVKTGGWLKFNYCSPMEEGSNSKRKYKIEHKEGYDYCRDTGRWNFIRQVIDRACNWYEKLVIDGKTGEVLRNISHPLAEHRGRGSAKIRPAEK